MRVSLTRPQLLRNISRVISLIREFEARIPRHVTSGSRRLTNERLLSAKDIFAFELFRTKISRFQYPSAAAAKLLSAAPLCRSSHRRKVSLMETPRQAAKRKSPRRRNRESAASTRSEVKLIALCRDDLARIAMTQTKLKCERETLEDRRYYLKQ